MDTDQKYRVIDSEVVLTEKTVREKAGDDTEDNTEATLADHIAQARHLMEEQPEDRPEESIVPETNTKLESMDEFAAAVERIKEENKDEKREQLIKARAESRANQDVAMAMMIADEKQAQIEAMNEMSGDTPTYVAHGAKMICSMGSREARLVLPMDHGVYLKNHPQMTADDCKALTNIRCFGNCFSTENPAMKEAAADAVESYNEQNSGVINQIRSWFKMEPAPVDPSVEMLSQCICECEPKIVAAFWEDANEKSLVDTKPTITRKCIITCAYGGVIRIYTDGQDE